MKKNYKTQYLNPLWQKKRLEILERDEYTCCGCGGEEKTLHVHHRYYVNGRDVWDYPNFTLITLCEECHENHRAQDPDIIEESGWYRWESEINWEHQSKQSGTDLFNLLDSIRCDAHEKLGLMSASEVIDDVATVLYFHPEVISQLRDLASLLRNKKGSERQ